MKILSVRIKNLNSLKGDFFIDFEKEPFATHSLFAIVGPTGAGKTTILDAITLALYGRVFRYGNAEKNEFPKDRVVTYGEKEASAEVIFIGKDNLKYASKWSIRYKRTGVADDPQRQFANIETGKILANKIKEVDEHIEKTVGLKYSQFIRSVILPQGNFAAFLKADENEKAAILEYITGTEEFSKISKLTFQICKQEEQKLKELKSKLAHFTPLTEEQKKAILQEITELENTLAEHKNTLKTLQEQHELHKKIHALTQDIEKIRQDKMQLEEHYEPYQPHFSKYEFYLKNAHLTELYETMLQLKTQKQQKQDEYHTYTRKLEQLKPDFERQKQKILQTEQQIANIQQTIEHKTPTWEKAKEIEKTITQYTAQIQEIERKIEQHQNDLKNVARNIENTQNQIQTVEQKQKNIQQWLDTHAHHATLAENASLIESHFNQLQKYAQDKQQHELQLAQLKKDLQALHQNINALLAEQEKNRQQKETLTQEKQNVENNIEQLRSQLPDTPPEQDYILTLKKLHQIATSFLKNQQEFDKQTYNLQKYTTTLQNIKQEYSETQQKELDLDKIIEKKKQQIELQKDIEELAPYRVKLKKGEPCPLCGATEHPFAHKVSHTLSQLQSEIESYQEEYQEIKNQLKYLKNKQEDYQAKIQATQNQLQELQNQAREYQNDFFTLNTYPYPFDITQAEPIKNALSTAEQEYNHYQKLLKDIQQYEKELREKTQRIEKYSEQLYQVTEKYSDFLIQQKEHETHLKNIEQNIENINREVNKIEQTLQHLYPDYTPKTPFSVIKNLISEYQNQNQTLQNLSTEKERLTATLKNYNEQLQKLQQDIQNEKNHSEHIRQLKTAQEQELAILMPERSVQEDEKYYQQLLQQEREHKDLLTAQSLEVQNKITQTQTLIEKTKQDTENIHTHIEQVTAEFEKAQENAKISQEQFESLYLNAEERKNIKTHYETYAQKINELQTLLADKTHQKNTTQPAINPAMSFETVQLQMEDYKNKIEHSNQEIGKRKEMIAQDEKIRKEQSQLYEQIQKQQLTFDKWKELNDLIGSEKGDKFRKFAQGLTLAKLAVLANEHLKHLNPRYKLSKKATDKLELEVIDAYQADETRDIASLSGGETFLVSLALALGLSDLVGQDARISSLFIDEGFGTLDPDTLDTAITALENLQMSGKIVGVISHVDALKERIHAKIMLEKTNDGTSTLKVFPKAARNDNL